ncbi:D-alanyl-D-alanine endopeptidase [Methylobacillus gramineus]|uniref:D-alanyl-D-alanine endopeptidase n=1 Tax=Methylobacillus gramineus TaxID=755169 RepID=UPI001CFFFAFB|nr:D-alanyl-D-alanine endopeptidase [Methylobacillus gramineus]MCB5185608.1 D-alanyl-D-alanine endopeptidase [Methylobacillus gramineus]
MIRKFTLLLTMLALCMPPLLAYAAEKKPQKTASSKTKSSQKVVAKKKPKTTIAKKNEASGRIISTIRSNSKVTKSSPNPSVFKDEIGNLQLASTKALIVNQNSGEVLYAKSTDLATPIASVTKLMTAMVMLDAKLDMDEKLLITRDDVDTLKGTSSRMTIGTALSRAELLQLALMASENRAASALGRNYPGGLGAFVAAMNVKALQLGMMHSHFADPTGLNSSNVSTAEDLVKMVRAAYQYPEIRHVSTSSAYSVPVHGMRNPLNYVNSNVLVRNSDWVIGLSKTGYINEAGRCLVMQAEIAGQPLIIVLLDSFSKSSRIGDAQRIRKWIESSNSLRHMS